MTDRPNSSRSAAVGDHALITGVGAALIATKLLPSNPKAILLHKGVSGPALDAALEAVDAIKRAGVGWHEDQIASAEGSAEGRTDPMAAESESWITNSEAARILMVTDRQVRYYREERKLMKSRRVGAGYEFDLVEVSELSRRRSKERSDD